MSKSFFMADITVSSQKTKSLASPRIDLTPMVDLGFLLITFFVFTATLNNPTAMTTVLPADSKDSSRIAESGAVSIIADADNVYLYTGNQIGSASKIFYHQPETLRTMLIGIQQKLMAKDGNDDKLFVMIKPTEHASFGTIVDLLDEMKICRMKRYTLTDPSTEELASLSIY